ncbi:terpenoid cyclases/Protein prenyltransferase [Tilletiaria anomala UBC 951]|uniref:Geranylgeranyl transferase type-2 subunit beta n=1 Tax=Tilletiaria anomala (strain ATCC 24038 / CBS 436.72 / UBC 951) TaxID=1037660 RepID=A0A066VU34_TILAU|nr:terpenoid cyclases/Protein prenyltransferase [Tilletiaria anomala UBC 951]KDN42309.1 terpenoid cyclases/Protein prenyltransferase [Tilletiaria anomala UBC 951]
MALPQAPQRLLRDLHVAYIKSLDAKKEGLSYHMTTHLRMNGVYWGLCALELMHAGDLLARQDLVDFVLSCWDDPKGKGKRKAELDHNKNEPAGQHRDPSDGRDGQPGGFAPFPRHDTHILSTLSALQILAIKGALDVVDRQAVIDYILSLRSTSPNLRGAFYGDSAALEHDTRYLYIALHALQLLSATAELAEIREESIAYLLRCHNRDGGFGTSVGAESHAGQVFTCVAALNILDALDRVDLDRVGSWLAERQLPNGGLNGRPQKLEDVCYSWWVLSSLSMVRRLHWIDAAKLRRFILSAQDPEYGGIADRPDNVADVFHTHFGLAGLSLLSGLDRGTPQAKGQGAAAEAEAAPDGNEGDGLANLEEVDPTYCLPAHVVRRLGIEKGYQSFRPANR